ncbi:Carbon monoxide dehydrogenase subunit G (CoxG) [Streptomyces sp. YIM 130001]|uniref:SRPBCC family protein n=1 Tax=Streptomyces sp. YIM 130001 TaxID=2259644 RepID=UPI000E65C847|nr:SRPBCC family protein [Streptomyces sp. YIM 130001]RII08588.1 Carbon monoxide dehydrogenase subunit G (CoxG) [Streptomyces sp. YIM 130001]
MEHEVFVPVLPESVRAALGDASRVARSVPGLQREAHEGAEPVAGRLKVRIAGHSITYRGALRVTERTGGAEPSFAVDGDATEARGTGGVQLSLTVRLLPADGGTKLVFSGSAKAQGRVSEFEPSAVASAGRRLLDRFAQRLAEGAGEQGGAAPRDAGAGSDSSAARSAGAGADAARDAGAEDDAADGGGAPGADDAPDAAAAPQGRDGSGPAAGVGPASEFPPLPGAEPFAGVDPHLESGSVFDAEVPPSSLDPSADDDFAAENPYGEPPAEAAHARRTMIGRSAEEVDHAPPHGRYAPVPAPEGGTATDTLRWAAPVAAVLVVSAVAAGRILRRRR